MSSGSLVAGLGYVVVETVHLAEWELLLTDTFGVQVTEPSPGELNARVDDLARRMLIRYGPAEKVTAVGWEVRSPQELVVLRQRLDDGGYEPRVASTAGCESDLVSDAFEIVDPDGLVLQFHSGPLRTQTPFVSPTGARFKTGSGGLGHVFQGVSDAAAFEKLYIDVLGFRRSDIIELGPVSATFLHCNRRHHSYAFAQLPPESRGIGHLMLEVDDIDTVGRAWDRVVRGAAPIAETLGRHTNDEMISFYARTPSGLRIEYGFGGLELDDGHVPGRYNAESRWGHVKPAEEAAGVIRRAITGTD